jgi:hypothetical protein
LKYKPHADWKLAICSPTLCHKYKGEMPEIQPVIFVKTSQFIAEKVLKHTGAYGLT